MRWLLALALASCGDDLTLPSPEIGQHLRTLVPAGDSVYLLCDTPATRICARRGTEPIREVATTEYDSMIVPGRADRVAVFTATLDGGKVGELDPATDEITWFGEIVGSSYPRALLRAGDRVIVDDGSLWSVGSDGDVVELPFTVEPDSLIVQGDLATYAWTATLWRTDGTLTGTSEIPGFSDVTAIVPNDGGAIVVGERGDDDAIWRTDATKLLDLDDDDSLETEVICASADASVLVVADHLITGTTRLDSPTFNVGGPGAWLDGSCHFLAGTIEANPQRGLWRFAPDGTPELVHELPYIANDEVVAHADRVYFRVHTPDAGVEPWVSDGTSHGTHIAWDLALGPTSSYPHDYAVAGDHLHFLATVAGLPIDLGYQDESCALAGLCESLCSTP